MSRRRRSITSSCGEAQHIAVYAANTVVAAHDRNYLHMKSLIRLTRLAQNAAEHPVENDELLLWASEAMAGPTGPAERRLAPPRLGSPPTTADSRPIHMSLGAFNDRDQMGSSLPGLARWPPAGGSSYGYVSTDYGRAAGLRCLLLHVASLRDWY